MTCISLSRLHQAQMMQISISISGRKFKYLLYVVWDCPIANSACFRCCRLGDHTKKIVEYANENDQIKICCDGPYGSLPFNYLRYGSSKLLFQTIHAIYPFASEWNKWAHPTSSTYCNSCLCCRRNRYVAVLIQDINNDEEWLYCSCELFVIAYFSHQLYIMYIQ